LRKAYFDQFGRFIPYDFVNQVIPVIFNITGEETIDVVVIFNITGEETRTKGSSRKYCKR
jgi:hypothetical protein